jgi:ribosomal protein L13E
VTAFSVIPSHGMPSIDIREASRVSSQPFRRIERSVPRRRFGDDPTARQGRGFARARRHAAGLSPVTRRNNLVK